MSDNEVIEIRQVLEFADFSSDVQEAASGFQEMKASRAAQARLTSTATSEEQARR
jgi:hypothetical protein